MAQMIEIPCLYCYTGNGVFIKPKKSIYKIGEQKDWKK